MLGHVGAFPAPEARDPGRRGHVALLADEAGLAVRPGLPLLVGGLHPYAERIPLVVAVSAEPRALIELVVGGLMGLGLSVLARAVLDVAQRQHVVAVEGLLAFDARDHVADLTGDASVGRCVRGGRLWRDIAGEECFRAVALNTAGLDLGHLRIQARVRERELEVLRLVPLVGERLGHRRLPPLLVHGSVASAAVLRGMEVRVAGRALLGRLLARAGRGGRRQCGQGKSGDPAHYHHLA